MTGTRQSRWRGGPEPVLTPFLWAVTGVLVQCPVGLVAGLASARLDRPAVADLVVEFGALPPSAQQRC